MATVEDLYRQVLGREPDPEGKAFWESAFGGSVDPAEQASFMKSVQSVLASAPPAQQATLAPKLVAEATATGVPVTTVAASVPPPPAAPVAPTAPVDPTVKLFQDTLGRAPTQGEIERFGGDIKAGQLSNFLGYARNEAVNTMPTTGAAGNIASQILAQGTTDKWGGEGYGSATKNAYDMGVMLAGQGIKDINDFGQRTNASGEKEFFNKATGEAIKPFYDRAGDNIWGGTFAGKDSTAYGVEFDATGKPLFYSQSGGDSADVPSWVVPALVIGGAYFGLGGLEGLFGGAGGTAGTAGLSALDAGLGVYGTGAAGTAGSIAGGLSALDAGMGVYGTGGTAGGLAGGLSALDAGMGVYPSTGNIGLSALDAGMGVYPNTGNIIPSALDAGMGVYPNTGNIIPSALDAGMGVYPNTGNIGLSALDAGMGVYGTGGTVLPSTGVGTGIENILSNLTPGQIANIVGGVGGLLGGAGVARAVTGGGGTEGGVGALPTQGVPLNTADYYRAIQQNYNRLLPAVPRDVATPLAQWYNSTYGA
jgi:hypothetical protein